MHLIKYNISTHRFHILRSPMKIVDYLFIKFTFRDIICTRNGEGRPGEGGDDGYYKDAGRSTLRPRELQPWNWYFISSRMRHLFKCDHL